MLNVCSSNIYLRLCVYVLYAKKLWDNINAYNGATSNSSRSSVSSIESTSESHGKLNTQQSIVEVHSPPRDIMPDVISDKEVLAKAPLLSPPLSAPTFTPKSMPTLPTSKSAPILSTLKSTSALSSPKSAPASPALASSKIPSTSPPPPPPPPPPTPIGSIPPFQTQKSAPSTTSTFNKTEVSKNIKFFNGTCGQEEVQKELKFVLTMFREKKANSSLSSDMHEIWVNQYSTSREIQTWLAAKGFSEKICKQLENMNGMELFNLSRRRLEQLCGLSEGSRLNGQLTLAKNECGYKTARSSELKQILEKARQRAEELNDKDEVRQ